MLADAKSEESAIGARLECARSRARIPLAVGAGREPRAAAVRVRACLLRVGARLTGGVLLRAAVGARGRATPLRCGRRVALDRDDDRPAHHAIDAAAGALGIDARGVARRRSGREARAASRRRGVGRGAAGVAGRGCVGGPGSGIRGGGDGVGRSGVGRRVERRADVPAAASAARHNEKESADQDRRASSKP